MSRLRFLLLAMTTFSTSILVQAEQTHPLVRDVSVIPDTTRGSEDIQNWSIEAGTGDHFLPGTVEPSGWGLVQYYGCVSCHNLPDRSGTKRWGPDLDLIGDKVYKAWIQGWLADPSAMVQDAKMPRVPLSETEGNLLVDLLSSRRGLEGIQLSGTGDPKRGKRIFDSVQCRACHTREGRGGTIAPNLDKIHTKVKPIWLVSYLLNPTQVIPNTRMTDFGFDQKQAEDVAAYLLGEGKPTKQSRELEVSKSRIKESLSVFAQKGCAGCHRMGEYVREIPLPDSEDVSAFLSAHERPNSVLNIEIGKRQITAMRVAISGTGSGGENVDGSTFLASFWKTPIESQGWAPASHDTLASKLDPESCGACHAGQLVDWTASRHSMSMGSGVMGQLEDALWGNPGFVEGCQSCHAPTAEQHPMLHDGKDEEYGVNYGYSSDRQNAGVDCMACHVRSHVRFGPGRGERPPVEVWRSSGHGGGVPSPAFSKSEFCRGCHQFEKGQRRINQKLLQDTFAQWSTSTHAEFGQTCQSCHMPGRRHLFKGIHDPEMVRGALEVQVVPMKSEGDSLAFQISIFNRGAGHHLPTYVTPKIFVESRLMDKETREISGTRMKRVIGWDVVLGNREREVYDTRIPSGGVWVWRYCVRRHTGAEQVEVSIEVHPDHFYLGVFEQYDRAGLSPSASAMIDSAEAVARRSPFSIFRELLDLSKIDNGRTWDLSR